MTEPEPATVSPIATAETPSAEPARSADVSAMKAEYERNRRDQERSLGPVDDLRFAGAQGRADAKRARKTAVREALDAAGVRK